MHRWVSLQRVIGGQTSSSVRSRTSGLSSARHYKRREYKYQRRGYSWRGSEERRDTGSDASWRSLAALSIAAPIVGICATVACLPALIVFGDWLQENVIEHAHADSAPPAPSSSSSQSTSSQNAQSGSKVVIESSETAAEPRSGISVPVWIQLPAIPRTAALNRVNALESQQELIGTSVRTVTVFGFLTYTLAVYADSSDLRNAWSSSSLGQKSDGIPADPKERASSTLVNLIRDSRNTRTLRIVNYRKIDSSHFCHSLSTGLSDRWRRAGLETSALEPLTVAFRSFFKTKDLPAGTIIDFSFRQGTLRVFINGEAAGSISDMEFEQQFLGMFLGDRARAENMRADIAASVLKRLL